MDPFIAGCGVLLVASASYGLKVLKNHSDQKKLQAWECKNICVWGLSLSNRYGMEIA